jgi:hypothetical protein
MKHIHIVHGFSLGERRLIAFGAQMGGQPELPDIKEFTKEAGKETVNSLASTSDVMGAQKDLVSQLQKSLDSDTAKAAKISTMSLGPDSIDGSAKVGSILDKLNNPEQAVEPQQNILRGGVSLPGQPAANAPEAAADQPEGAAGENPAETMDAADEAAEELPEPKTVGEKLERDLNKAMDNLSKAKKPVEAIVAMIRVAGTLAQYLDKAMKGKLDEPLNGAPEADAKNNPEGKTGKPEAKNTADATSLEKELEDRLNKKPEVTEGKTAEGVSKEGATVDKQEDRAEAINGLKTEKTAEITENTTDIEKLDADVKTMKEENEQLITKKGELEKSINNMRGDESMKSELASAEIQLKSLAVQIDAKNEGITSIDKQRDDLSARNKQLESDVVTLDKMKTDTEAATKRIAEVTGEVAKILSEKFPGKKMPTFKIELGADGKVSVEITGMNEEFQKELPEGSKVEGETATIEGDKLAAVTENTETAEKPKESIDAFGEEPKLKSPKFYETRMKSDQLRMELSSAAKDGKTIDADTFTKSLDGINESYYAFQVENPTKSGDKAAAVFTEELNGHLAEMGADYRVKYSVDIKTFETTDVATTGKMEDIKEVQATGGAAEQKIDGTVA